MGLEYTLLAMNHKYRIAWLLRLEGETYKAIAKRLGYKDGKSAKRLIEKATELLLNSAKAYELARGY